MKIAAGRVGLSLEAYEAKVAAGLKWCTACKAWHSRKAFVRDRTRGDGLKATCLVADRRRPRGYRDPEKEEARRKVAVAVRYGKLAHPNSLACTDCGHRGRGKRHEYDHYKGYAEKHHLSVQCVCTTCHADREVRRRRG